MTRERRADVAVVGAGILGLAHAWHLARKGLKVAVFDRTPGAQGASVRNFGMVWPVGQPPGERLEMALRSREYWVEVLGEAGLWSSPAGSLHVAYREDEWAVLREFVEREGGKGYRVKLLTAVETLQRSPVNPEGLLGSMFSETEVCVDARSVIAGLPGMLSGKYGVEFYFESAVTRVELPEVVVNGETWQVDMAVVCGGDDLATLYPEVLKQAGMTPCKLQMMRTAPQPGGWRIGPMLAGGLTLRHYESFTSCPSLPAYKQRVSGENPFLDQFGIHVMASQNGAGEVIIGDSHEYGANISPFDRPEIDQVILDYLATFLPLPDPRIAARWHGVYAKHPSQPWVVAAPHSKVRLVTGVGGAGMTLSFGLAAKVTEDLLA